VFENRVLRRICGLNGDEATGEWRKLRNEELRDLYSSRSIIRIIKSRRMRWVGHVARLAEKKNAYRLLVGKPEGKWTLGRPRHRWVYNITIWTELVWLRIGTELSSCEFGTETFGFHKMLGNYRVSKQLGISQVVLSSIDLVYYY
jgi:hypothetical protein